MAGPDFDAMKTKQLRGEAKRLHAEVCGLRMKCSQDDRAAKKQVLSLLSPNTKARAADQMGISP